ncbi:Opioid growth factor receptor [Lonchura striata]|uniref:Opioid growth factor receptor n=1 Tax=Lonchura striata TaxID=40157 RepID=A0A218UZ93_9PASE|nr:opioid growth factor receptor [Lonchura striata domestica]OWK59115.1 Opioid growth factor receptor [Lonchura striata domestica]
MAAWFAPRAEEDEAEDEANLWKYDSTWEGEEEDGEEQEDGGGGEAEAAAAEEAEDAGEQPGQGRAWGWRHGQDQSSNSSLLSWRGFQCSGRRNWTAARDLQRYRNHYPDLKEPENEEDEEMWNLSFYKNEIAFVPHGVNIETLLSSWGDKYETLEENHSYIQWLFPLREHGMNWRARPLTCQEIQAFRKSKEVMDRFIRAYKLMLGFYGINLVNEETGELERAENWCERFENLNRFSHNNLRITRILKCLGEMGYEDYQVHLVKFFLTETLVEETLPNVKRSALDYFLFTVRSKEKRRELIHYAWQHFKPQSSFVWGPREKLRKYRPRSAKPQLHQRPEEKQDTPCQEYGDPVEKDQNQSPEVEQKAGKAAELQPEMSDEHVKEKISKCVLKVGDDEEEKEASFSQLEEKDLKSEAEEGQGTAENDCTKESKKRKLNASLADAKGDGSLKNSADIENISHNLGECAIDAEVPSSDPVSQVEESQEALKEGDSSTKEPAVPEAADAAVKRRKVDKRTLRGKQINLAINLSMGPSASGAKANPSAANGEAGKESVSEKNAAVEVPSEKGGGGGDADGGAVRPPAASRPPRTGCTAPIKDGWKSSGDQDLAGGDQHHCNSKILGGKSELDGVGQQEKAGEKGQAEDTDKKQAPESHEQTVTPTCPEENRAEVPAEKGEGSANGAEPGGEQGAAE